MTSTRVANLPPGPPISAFLITLVLLVVLCQAFASCTTIRPDGTTTRVDAKAVKAITKPLAEFMLDLAYRRYIAPAPTQTLYDGPRVITSKVPWP